MVEDVGISDDHCVKGFLALINCSAQVKSENLAYESKDFTRKAENL